MINGVLCVNKPKNTGSTDIVKYFQRIVYNKLYPTQKVSIQKPNQINQYPYLKVNAKIKIGHAGTLDPIATGCLILGFGTYTKALSDFHKTPKTYQVVGLLGMETDTLDKTGKITHEQDASFINKNEIEQVLPEFIGAIDQKPPLYSAIKINGKILYEEARKNNTEIEKLIKERTVEISDIELLNFLKINDKVLFDLMVTSGKGVYMRALVRDIGLKLNTRGCMVKLHRWKQGCFDAKHYVELDKIDTFDDILKYSTVHTPIYDSWKACRFELPKEFR